MSDDQRSSNAERETGKARRVKVHKMADTLMRWLIVLVVAIIFVVLADELITTPFFSAELEGEATGSFGTGPSCRNRGLAYWTYNC